MYQTIVQDGIMTEKELQGIMDYYHNWFKKEHLIWSFKEVWKPTRTFFYWCSGHTNTLPSDYVFVIPSCL